MTKEWKKKYPFCSKRLNLNGVDMHYVDEGSGTPVLMVHGNPTWSFYWRHLMTELKSDHRAIAVDHIGCGLSDKPQQYEYTLSQHIENLVAFIDELDLRNIVLLGHDWGGAIGLGAAVARPERFSRFVMFNTAAFPPPFFPLRIRICRTPMLGKIALRGMNLFSLSALWLAIEKQERVSPEFRSGIIAPYDSWAARVAVDRFVRDIPTSPTQPTWQKLCQIESGLKQFESDRFGFIWGMRDWCFRPECLDRFLRILPGAFVHRIEGAGHWVVEEAREEVAEVLRKFLDETKTAFSESNRSSAEFVD